MKTLLVCCSVLLLCTMTAKAQQQGHSHGKHMDQQPAESGLLPARLSIPDVEILNQDGKKQRLFTDLIKGRKVVINFIYTTCTAYCPLSGNNFAKLQTLLGERLGKDVFLLSISTDPETDTPAKLKIWSERFGPKPGWTLVTGNTPAMQTLLRAFLGEGPRRGFHTPVAFVVDDKSGGWKRTYGLEQPAKLVEMLDQVSVQAQK
jgi:protein SCO1